MKSDEIVRHYVHHTEPAPSDGWRRLLWMAAELVRRAQHERHTYRPLRRESYPQICRLVDSHTITTPKETHK